MADPKLFVVVVIRDNSLMAHWSFRAAEELAVARQILADVWRYEDLFWALRISLQDVERLSPETLLAEIHGSYPNQRVRAVVHLFPIAQPADSPAAVNVV